MRPMGLQLTQERDGHETLLVRRGRRSAVTSIVAVHSTALGPALGGCRMWSYATLEEAVTDALRLSRAMTLKAAVAGLPLGGGKSVICLPAGASAPTGAEREAILHDFAEALELLDGSYITAEDVGTHSSDMALLAQWTSHVVGRPRQEGGGGDPGAFTAAGVEAAVRASLREAFGSPEPGGRSVAIVGAGSVGGALARLLTADGAELVLADIDPAKQTLADELGASWMSPAEALRAEVDVLAPCALGGVIDRELLPALRCGVICGAANNQLAEDTLAMSLAERGILYAPDFVVNAAGLINASLELTGYDGSEARERAAGIETVLERVFERASETYATPLAAAVELAQERLREAGGPPTPREQRHRASTPRRRRLAEAGLATASRER
jgi:leucine dehydrogenase